jgi:uncharacterized protein
MTSMTEWFGRTTNRLYPRFTHDAGPDLVAGERAEGLEEVTGGRYCTVVSFRRDGTPVATPVWFGLSGGALFFRSLADSYKIRRIRSDPRVLVAPCSRRGRPTGLPFEGRARILEGEGEEAAAEAAIQANFGAIRAGYEVAIRDAEARYVEVRTLAEVRGA